MTAWITPKTDWYGNTDENGVYHGDRFNASDYNRIKNNLQFLHYLALKMQEAFQITDMGPDKQYDDFPYADEINLIEDNLDAIAQNTFMKDYGEKTIFNDNGRFIDYNELNRIEKATLDLYDKLMNKFSGRRMLTFMFGMRGGV